jgi:uncharacterized glyoxalase superfamily protein PhnB
MKTASNFQGLLPCLPYQDANTMLDWLSTTFGFTERSRYVDQDGIVRQAEMLVGGQELWLSGHGPGYWAGRGGRPDLWIGVWVDDVDAQYERIRATGVDTDAPVDRDYDVRSLNVFDPEGYQWGFLKRLGQGYVQSVPTDEGGLQEILPDS